MKKIIHIHLGPKKSTTLDAGPTFKVDYDRRKGYWEVKLPNGRTIKGDPLSKFIQLVESEGYKMVSREDGSSVTFRAKDAVKDANPDGTVSDDEERRTKELVQKALKDIESWKKESESIGGSFRGPGIRAQIRKAIAGKI